MYLPNGLCGWRKVCVPRELSTYLTHVGDDKAKMNKGYVRICRCCGDAWLCSQSLDFWASPGTTRACCSCPTHVNCVNCVCNVTRWNKGKNQGRQERNRPKFAHKTAPKPISNVPEAVCRLRYPQCHRNGERYRELAPEPQMRRAKWKVEDQNFSGARVSGSVPPSVMGLFSFRFIGIRDPWIEC